MASLLDIAPVSENVTVGAASIAVYGVSGTGIVDLMVRFPVLLDAMNGEEPDAATLLRTAPQAIAAIIAAGCGMPGDKAYEDKAASLAVETQLDFLTAILRLTFPNGIASFVAKVVAVMGSAGGEAQPQTVDVDKLRAIVERGPQPKKSPARSKRS